MIRGRGRSPALIRGRDRAPAADPTLPSVCVIGAGSSGIAVAKALADRRIPFDCFEASDRVGGNWVFKNSNGMSSAYRSLHINTSRERMQYADFPMPADYPDFPHHSLIARYFDAYVDHFQLRRHIRFSTRVEAARRRAGGTWEIDLAGGQTRAYDALAVANGHHWDPRLPEPPFPGRFSGIEMHSHHYVDPTDPHDLRQKRVVVVGMGNSAMDIACELSRADTAARVFLAARRGAHIIPKYLFGRPLDQWPVLQVPLPFAVRRAFGQALLRVAVGAPERYGLPRPDHKLGAAHPTISSDILTRVGHGDIIPKPTIARLRGAEVEFADGSVEAADAIIYCTGYKVTFPFFDPDLVAAPDNDLPLFLRVFKPGLDNLFFVGLCQPLGAVMPIAEAQGKWIADYLCGRYALPPRPRMVAHMLRERRALQRRYVASPRHTMQVDFDDYLHALSRERARGGRRAVRAGYPRPIRARAVHRPEG